MSAKNTPDAKDVKEAPKIKPFRYGDTYYDMTTFKGRSLYFYNAINPLMLLQTEKSLAEPISIVDQVKRRALPKGKYTDAQLWDAVAKVEACVHPTTGQIIPAPFRMASFIPVNYFIVPIMMLPSTVTSVWRTVAIHWFNQSFNAAINYSNRGSEAQPVSDIFKAYVAAVTVSLVGALSCTFALRRIGSASGILATGLRATLPCFAVAAAGSANVGLMRKNEWMGEGIPVTDEDGNVRGKSKRAGVISWYECSIARVLWNIPCMTLPPILGGPLCRIPALGAHPAIVETMLIYLGLVLGVPPALAFYPPVEKVSSSRLEPVFQSMKCKNGKNSEFYTFPKGL